MIPDWVMLAATLVLFWIAVYVGRAKDDPFIFLVCALALLYEIYYYGRLVLDPSDMASRMAAGAVFRPGQLWLFVGLALSWLNGRIIRFFKRIGGGWIGRLSSIMRR